MTLYTISKNFLPTGNFTGENVMPQLWKPHSVYFTNGNLSTMRRYPSSFSNTLEKLIPA